MWRSRPLLADDAHHLLELLPQSLIGMQAPGCIHEHSIDAPTHGGINGVEGDGGGVAPLRRADEWRGQPVGPDLQLLRRARAKGIRGRQQHGPPFRLQ